MVLRLRQHNIGYTADGTARSFILFTIYTSDAILFTVLFTFFSPIEV